MRTVVVLLLMGCHPGTLADTEQPDTDTMVDVDTGVDSDTSAEFDWSAVQDALHNAQDRAPTGVDGMGLLVWDRDGDAVLRTTTGDMDLDERIPVASASKLITALVLLRLEHQGILHRTDTTGDVLGWDAPWDAVTLDHLGAFVSGLPVSGSCVSNPLIALQTCTEQFPSYPPTAVPGGQLDYGPTHLHTAAAMAEVLTEQPFNELLHTALAEPLGLQSPELLYYALPQQQLGERNPRVSGGLWATADEYGTLLRLILADGQAGNEQLLSTDGIDRLFRNPYTSAQVGDIPDIANELDMRYGFGAWLECPDAAQCDVFNSAGSFGTVPWVDRANGYSALLWMYGPGGTAEWSVRLEQDLQPLIIDVLDGAP